MSLILLDTNIVLRLLDRAAPEHSLCVGAIENLLRRGDTPCLAPQILIEFWVVATRPVDVNGFSWSEKQVADAIDHLRVLFPLLADTPALFETWLTLVIKYPQNIDASVYENTSLINYRQ
ncbi:MAG: nuclease [Methylovulum sp.]|nr:MAG: nuclease [Methylovulum sp.]